MNSQDSKIVNDEREDYWNCKDVWADFKFCCLPLSYNCLIYTIRLCRCAGLSALFAYPVQYLYSHVFLFVFFFFFVVVFSIETSIPVSGHTKKPQLTVRYMMLGH